MTARERRAYLARQHGVSDAKAAALFGVGRTAIVMRRRRAERRLGLRFPPRRPPAKMISGVSLCPYDSSPFQQPHFQQQPCQN